jgi:hypothetical protein
MGVRSTNGKRQGRPSPILFCLALYCGAAGFSVVDSAGVSLADSAPLKSEANLSILCPCKCAAGSALTPPYPSTESAIANCIAGKTNQTCPYLPFTYAFGILSSCIFFLVSVRAVVNGGRGGARTST